MISIHDIGQLIERVPRRLTKLRREWTARTDGAHSETWEALDVYLAVSEVIRLDRPYVAGGRAWSNWGTSLAPDDWHAWRKVAWCSTSVWPRDDEGMWLFIETGSVDHHPENPPIWADLMYDLSPLVVAQFIVIRDALIAGYRQEAWAMAMGRAGYEWDNVHALELKGAVLSFIRRALQHHDLYQGWP